MSRALEEAAYNQAIAADPAMSVFVTANAGSGKTKVLVDRIARLLLKGSNPSAFLCITYTKAAAAEMQRRLFERLGAWCVADDATLGAELAKLGAPEADYGLARALFAQALETPGGLKIQTIHAFCERLLSRFPVEAGVPPGFDIADEARARALLQQARAEAALAPDAPRQAFARFAARLYGDALDRLLDRLALRRADFLRFSEKRQGPLFAEAEIRNRHGATQSVEDVRRRFLARQDWEGLRAAANMLADSSKNDRATGERLRRVLAWIDRGDDAAAVESCFEFALTDGQLRANLATKALSGSHPWLEPLLRAFAEDCVRIREKLMAIERAEDAIAALALALKLDEAYARAKRRSGVLDFDDLIAHAHALMHRSSAAPWVLYKLDGGLDHILIDEGQDTSPSQWDLIRPLQDEFFAGAGARARERTLFAVGDPKQSIYGFQGADPLRFVDERRKLAMRAGERFTAPDLRTSFRSAPEILRCVDAVLAMRPLTTAQPETLDAVEHLAARDDDYGAVEVWPLAMRPAVQQAMPWDAPQDAETGASVHAILANHIAERVRGMIAEREAVWDKDACAPRPVEAGDVMALVRTRGPLFHELIKAFKRAGLPVAGADRMTLKDELAVEDALALIRVALDPADDLSLACVLKGPWCGLTDDVADLLPLAHGRAPGETLHARLQASEEAKYAFAKRFVEALAARRGADPFAFLSWALETPHEGGATGWTRVLARLGPQARDPLEELLQRALRLPGHAARTLQRFLHDIETDAGQIKRELEAQTGALRVMTVHGAKGLEAPIVILPDCTADIKEEPDSGLMFDDDGDPFVSLRKVDDDAKTAEARAVHEARIEAEYWRLLYVAMTRARDRLIVCGGQYKNYKSGESEKSWRGAVWQALQNLGAEPCETPLGSGLRLGTPKRATAGARVCASPPPLPHWARAPAMRVAALDAAAPSRVAHFDSALFSPRGDGQKRFRRGRLIHGLLQRLPDLSPERRHAAAIAWLSRQGAEESEAQGYVREALAVIADARFAAAFGPMSRPEAPIVGTVAGRTINGIVDRLAIDQGRVFVVDYKTDRPAPQEASKAPKPYVLQMALYREVLRQVFPDRGIACALLWTEAPRLMELPDEALDAALAAYLAQLNP